MTRHKITEPDELAEIELPELTAQQMEFVRLVVAGKTATDAYKAAYNTANSLQSTIWAEASRLRHNPKVAAWLSAAQRAALGATVPTLQEHCAMLIELREESRSSGNLGAAVQAEQLRGKAAGLYVEQHADVSVDYMAELKAIAERDPELAAALAKRDGIELETKH